MKRDRKFFRPLALIAATATAVTLAGCSADGGGGGDDDENHLSIGTQPTATGFTMWLAEENGYYGDEGLTVEFTYYPSGAAVAEAGITESWDAGVLGSPAALTASDKWGLIVAGPNAEESKSQVMWGRTADFEGKDPADVLRGSEILVKTNATQHYSMLACVEMFGIEDDFTPLTLEPDAIPGAFQSGQGTAAMTWPPFDANFVDNPDYMHLCDGAEAGVQIYNMIGLTPGFVEDRPEQAASFLVAAYEANDFITENPEEAAELLVKFYEENGVTVSVESALRELQERSWPSLADSLELYQSGAMAEALTSLTDTFVELGAFQDTPDVNMLVETGLPVLESATK
ncbi:ABC transporter substrate-binding protein [Humidisolicoccus flavus]|uniref:ABC transporter substrate-binding protein n=1 Tax=Humidisolicoccus flavus TaxID=3111414 RepID=UPI00324B398C